MSFMYTNGITHAGKFHADDVFSAAFLKILNPEIKIKRVFEVPEYYDRYTTIVFDIGRGEFDHHQSNSPVRDNGVPYAAFGLLWKKFGYWIFEDSKMIQKFDDSFVQEIDHSDNTGDYHQLSYIIENFNPAWNENVNTDEMFDKAVEFAKKILERIFAKKFAAAEAQKIVSDAYKKSDGKIVVLEQYVPWKAALINTSARFVVFPSDRGGFNAIALSKTETDNSLRTPFPDEWSSLEGKELQQISGIEGLLFCHKNCFLIHTSDLESAKKACEESLKRNNISK